ncbi:CG11242 [Drosophila busckii]|uniref:CG11242 n=1 Tax=Drosophila busckii TaxID=30019 RepID=A0A0M4EEC7_DROBS|nr:tubulin-folding cofactor B [Drosophila busckii]ALC42415.1 CG11242 [Drosophila busckii]
MSGVLHLDTGNVSSYITASVSNSHNDVVAFEMKFAKDMTIAQLKSKLEILTGGNAGTMKVELFKGDALLHLLDNNDAKLGYYADCDGLRLHVVDIFSSFAFDNESIEKFELSNDQYEKRTDSVRNFLKQNKLGKYNEEEMQQMEEKRRQQAEEIQKRASLCVVDSRCQVTVPGNPTRRGTIKYNGPLDGKTGVFIGVEYDEPLGKNNGSVAGKAYFECQPNYGGFVSPLSVEVGDFPPEEVDLDDEL